MKFNTQSKLFRIAITVIGIACLIGLRHWKSTQKSALEELTETYDFRIEAQCSSFILREAFINKMIRDTEAQAFSQAPSLAADLEKVLPNFLFNDKETHEKLFAELEQVDDLQSLEGAVALNPKLKKILTEQKNSYYEKCIDIQVKIWSECKSTSDSITTTRNCFQEKVSAPATWEELIATITSKAASK